jgi:hypothetical protein
LIAALCLAASAALGAEPTAAPAHFVWPKPEMVEEIDIPDVIQADGVPVRLHVVRSKMGVDQLLQTYATAFDKAGFYVALDQKRMLAEPHITALDWRTKISYSAILSPNQDGTTSCMLGEAALGKKATPTAASDFAPLMPNAREVVRIDQETDRLISFTVRAKADDVNRFYRESLPPKGFAAAPADEEPNLYGKGQERIRVMTKGKGDGTTSVVLMHRRSDR